MPATPQEPWSDEFSNTLAERRQEALDLLAAQRQQFERIEAELESHLADLALRLAEGIDNSAGSVRDDLDQFARTLHDQAEELSRQQEILTTDRVEIASRQAELQLAREQISREHQEVAQRQQQQAESLDRRAAEIQTLENKTKQAERALQAAQEDHENEMRQAASRRARFEEQQLRMEKELEELETRREETRTQRRRIAQQLKVERTALGHERELQHAEIQRHYQANKKDAECAQAQIREERESFEQEMQRARQQLRRDRQQFEEEHKLLEEARQEWEETRRQRDQHRDDQNGELVTVQQEVRRLTLLLAQAQRQSEEAADNLARLQHEHQELEKCVADRAGHEPADAAVLADFNNERSELTARISHLESQVAAAEKRLAERPLPTHTHNQEDLQRRFEMAVDDVRALKREKAELEEEIAEYQAKNQRSNRTAEGATEDWESTKRRLLAELQEEDGQSAGSQLSAEERLTVEGAIQITDDVVHQRDREIAELKQQLAGQNESSDAAQSAVNSAAVAQVLDQDALIQQERQRLLQMQQEWQDKLRQAEVEISVQRARIARERSEVDEKQRVLEDQKSALAAQQGSGDMPGSNKPQKPARRWLTRMGLKENDKD